MYTRICTALAQSRNRSCAITLSTLLLVTPHGTIAGRSQPQCKMPCYSRPKAAQKPKPQPSPPRVKPVSLNAILESVHIRDTILAILAQPIQWVRLVRFPIEDTSPDWPDKPNHMHFDAQLSWSCIDRA